MANPHQYCVDECFIIVRHSTPSSELVALLRKGHETLTREGGYLRRVDNLGVRPLAYRMRAHGAWNQYGRYMRVNIEASPHTLDEFVFRMENDEATIRMLKYKKMLAPQRPPELTAREARYLASRAKREAEQVEAKESLVNSTFMQRFKHLDMLVAQSLYNAGIVDANTLDNLPKWPQFKTLNPTQAEVEAAEIAEAEAAAASVSEAKAEN